MSAQTHVGKRRAGVPSSGGARCQARENPMRFSAPKRRPPGERPSRGAKLKGRATPRLIRCATKRTLLGVRGGARKPRASKEPRKRLTLEPRPLGWSRARAEKLPECRGTAEGRGGARQAADKKNRTTRHAELRIFFCTALVIAWRAPKQPQEGATQGTPLSPLISTLITHKPNSLSK